MLADALWIGGGDRAAARALTTELLDRAKETSGALHLEEMNAVTYQSDWSSDLRTTAIALQTLVNVTPDHPYVGKMARYLVQSRGTNGRYKTTQEAAFALMALTEVVRTREKDPPDFVGKVLIGGKQVAEAEFRGRSMEVRRTMLPMSQLPQLGKSAAFEFLRQGRPVSFVHRADALRAGGDAARRAGARAGRSAVDRAVLPWRTAQGDQGPASWCGSGPVGTGGAGQRGAGDRCLPAGSGGYQLATTARALRGEPSADIETDEMEDARQAGCRRGSSASEPVQPHRAARRPGAVLSNELPPGVHTVSVVARATSPGDYPLVPRGPRRCTRPRCSAVRRSNSRC
jgi:hypothetical protein